MALKLNNMKDLDVLYNDVKLALEEVANRHGLGGVKMTGLTYEREGGVVRFKAIEITSNDVEPGQREFERNAVFVGLKPSDFGRTFKARVRGGAEVSLQICGFKTRARRSPVLAFDKSNPNKVYRFDGDYVAMKLKQA